MSKIGIDWIPQDIGDGDIPSIQLWYPRNEGNAESIEIELSDVRAADSIQISYDFKRDGWSVKQASIFSWDGDDEVCDPDWQEVSFIKAWARRDSGS